MARKTSIPRANQRTAMIAARITPELKEKSERVAAAYGWTVSTLIERLLMRETEQTQRKEKTINE